MTPIKEIAMAIEEAVWPGYGMERNVAAKYGAQAALAVITKALRNPSEELVGEVDRRMDINDPVHSRMIARNILRAIADHLDQEGKGI